MARSRRPPTRSQDNPAGALQEILPRFDTTLPAAPSHERGDHDTAAVGLETMPATVDVERRVIQAKPRLPAELPAAPNAALFRKEFPFTGAWNPTDDPLLIGESNYADLQNFRYKDRSLITVLGYTHINTGAHGTYTRGRSGIHFLKSINGALISFVLAPLA